MTRTSPLYYLIPLALLALCDGFTTTVSRNACPTGSAVTRATTTRTLQETKLFVKGFGKPKEPESVEPKKPPSAASVERKQAVARYDEIAALGGQEYKIYVRQFGGANDSWLPVGSIAVPRTAQVSNAIKANLDNLKVSIVFTYPKLKGQEGEFEFGYNLKIYPDDPVEVANLNKALPTQGFSIGNWISTLLSPVDASGVPPPPIPEDKK
jgi:Family of unknown function (DUF6523)